MRFTKILSLFFIIFFSVLKCQTVDEKIGVIFKFNGPLIIQRDAIENVPRNYDNSDEKSKYYDAVTAMQNENINPKKRIIDFYLNGLNEMQIEYVFIDKILNEDNFPKFDGNRKFFILNLHSIKNNYDLKKILVVECDYGFEFESMGIIGGDKRTNVYINNSLVNTEDNSIIKNFRVQNIKNITKKGILSPPIYPNIEVSMSRLLNERIFPVLKSEIKKLEKLLVTKYFY